MTDLRKMGAEGPCCAHLLVKYTTEEIEGGLTRGWWKCKDCKTKFWPAGAAPSEGMKPGLPTVEQLAQRMAYQHPDMGPEERQRQWEKIPVDNPWRKQWLDTANLVLEVIQSALSPARSGEPLRRCSFFTPQFGQCVYDEGHKEGHLYAEPAEG